MLFSPRSMAIPKRHFPWEGIAFDGANPSLGAAAWPVAAGAQRGNRVRRIGFLTGLSADDPTWTQVTAFVQGL
jgi:hypothetical protein